MDRSLRLEYRYHDVDIVELRVSAWNGSFGGSTCLYVAQGELADTATLLGGFPVNVTDEREVTLGAFGPNFAGGDMALRFSCRDGAGHSELHITIEADYELRDSPAQRVEFLSAFEPAALDEFVEQMRVLNSSLTGSSRACIRIELGRRVPGALPQLGNELGVICVWGYVRMGDDSAIIT